LRRVGAVGAAAHPTAPHRRQRPEAEGRIPLRAAAFGLVRARRREVSAEAVVVRVREDLAVGHPARAQPLAVARPAKPVRGALLSALLAAPGPAVAGEVPRWYS